MHKQYHVLCSLLSLLITIDVHSSCKSGRTKAAISFEQEVVSDVCSQITNVKIKIAQAQKLDWSNLKYANNKDLTQHISDTVEQLQSTTKTMVDMLKHYLYDLGLKHQSSVMLHKQRLAQDSFVESDRIEKVLNNMLSAYEKLGFLVVTDPAFQDISEHCTTFVESFYPNKDPLEMHVKRPEAVMLLALTQRRILDSLHFELWYATMCAASKRAQDSNS